MTLIKTLVLAVAATGLAAGLFGPSRRRRLQRPRSNVPPSAANPEPRVQTGLPGTGVGAESPNPAERMQTVPVGTAAFPAVSSNDPDTIHTGVPDFTRGA